MIKQIIIGICILHILSGDIFANGGPANEAATKKLREVKLEFTPDVQVLEENLNFVLKNDSVMVQVVYTLKNKVNKKQEISYAFPIDVINNSEFINVPELPENMRITCNDSLLRHYKISESIDFKNPADYTQRTWYVSGFILKAQETVNLAVSYCIRAGYSDMENGKSYIPEFSPREFIWDFEPAQYWGNGTVDQMLITVDAQSIIDKKGSASFKGIKFEQKGAIYTMQAKNFDFRNASVLEVKYTYEEYLQNVSLLRSTMAIADSVNVSASSQLKGNYTAGNIVDNNFTTAWMEGSTGFGKNDFVEIVFKKPCQFNAIAVIPGYPKSEDVYNSNNRIKELVIVAYYADDDSTQQILSFPDKYLRDFPARVDITKSLIQLSSYPSNNQYIKKIRFIIKSVNKGTRYDDTGISEILFFNLVAG